MKVIRKPVEARPTAGDDIASAEELELVSASLPRVAAPEPLLTRILAQVRPEGRLAHFAEATAELLDLSRDEAQRLLDRLAEKDAFEPGFIPGMELCHVRGGPRVSKAITGFVRLPAGLTFPDHEHLGEESVLILQGRCEDQGELLGPGDRVSMPAGSRHTFRVMPGPDLVYLAVVHHGLRVGELTLNADDPRA